MLDSFHLYSIPFRLYYLLLLSYLRWSSVFSARGDMSDDTGVALLAHIDAVYFDNALARVEAGGGCHCSCRRKREEQSLGEEHCLHPQHKTAAVDIPQVCIYVYISCFKH